MKDSDEDLSHSCLMRAGEIFMYSIWLQNQMSDLIILQNNRNIITDFVNDYISNRTVPSVMTLNRMKYWERNFGEVSNDFITTFSQILMESEVSDLIYISQIRNAIAHSHYSLGRPYLLYRPSGGIKKEIEIIKKLMIVPSEKAAKPLVIKLDFSRDEVYLSIFSVIKRIDEKCFERICEIIGIPHKRIR